MPDVLIYSDTTYHITDGRRSIFEGEYKLGENGIFVEYPPESILYLTRQDKIMIKKAILDFCRDAKANPSIRFYEHPEVTIKGHCQKARPVHLKFSRLSS